MHSLGVEYFTGEGFIVVGESHLGLARQRDIQALEADAIRNLVRRGDTADAEAVFVSCTGLPVLPFLAELTEELGKPVLSSNYTLTRTLLELARFDASEQEGGHA